MNLMRYLTPGYLRPGASIQPDDDLPERQYDGEHVAFNPLARLASNRPLAPVGVWNGFRVISDYFVDEVNASFERVPDPWLSLAYRSALWFRSLYGTGVLVTQEREKPRAVNPRYWWPVMARGTRVGQAVVIPFFEGVQPDGAATVYPVPNRAIVAQVADDPANPQVQPLWHSVPYSGTTLGTIDWRPIDGFPPSILSFGDGRRDFPDAAPIIADVNEILATGKAILSRYSRPHLQVPASAVDYDSEGNPRVPISANGTIFPIQPGDAPVQYVTLSTDTDLYSFQLQTLLSLLSAVVSVPVTRFNIFPLARMESGQALEALAAPGNEKVVVWADQMIGAINDGGLPLTSRSATSSLQTSGSNQS